MLMIVLFVVTFSTTYCKVDVFSVKYEVYSSSKAGICLCGKSVKEIVSLANETGSQPHQRECKSSKPKDCGDIPRSCPSGVYKIYPKWSKGFKVFCEMNKYGGGWTRRENGAINFIRGWRDYKMGFGDPSHEFWLGNENIHAVTYQGSYQLVIELTDFDGNTAFARYRHFMVGSAATKYKLSVSQYSGNAGDSLTYQNGMAFTTQDRDNDLANFNCAKRHPGAWWFTQCMLSDLNGEYFYTKHPRGSYNGLHWNSWKGHQYSLKASTMMMRQL